jgi:MFS family permease
MISFVNEVLSWRWTFIILGIAGFAMTPLAILAMWEPRVVREKRMDRRGGKKSYSLMVSPYSLADVL